MKFYVNGMKDAPINYEGDRTEEAILDWLKEHTTYF